MESLISNRVFLYCLLGCNRVRENLFERVLFNGNLFERYNEFVIAREHSCERVLFPEFMRAGSSYLFAVSVESSAFRLLPLSGLHR